MKRIGILCGMENTFPPALVDRINQKKRPRCRASIFRIGPVQMAEPSGYRVIVDRISHDIAFYRADPEERRPRWNGRDQQPFLVERRR